MEAKSNFHIGQTNLHVTENFHAGAIRTGEEYSKETNFHAGNFHVGQLNSQAMKNFHVGQIDAKSNFHAGNFHAGRSTKEGNFHAGNFHAGNKVGAENFHAGNFHAGNFHSGNFHAGSQVKEGNFHAGNFHADNFHAGNFHAGGKAEEGNFHAGNFHAGNFHAGNFHAGNFHAGNKTEEGNFHAGNFHAGSKAEEENFYAGNFHAGDPGQSSDLVASRSSIRSEPTPQIKVLETSLSFYASTFDDKPGFNYVEKPANGIYSNVATSSHKLSVTDIRGSEDQLNLDRDAVLTISNISDHGNTFTDDASVVKDFYPEVEQHLLEHVPGAHRVFIFDHTIRRQFGDRGPVLRAHIDQTPASALARITRHLPDEADTLSKGRVRLINFWRPINGTVENYPLAFALSGSVPDTALEPVKHHYPTWTGETYGVGYSEGQKWCYWSKMGNNDALLLQCFDSEKGGRLAHSAIMDPTSTSPKFRASIEVRALVFG